jgi:SAM-dependent methyltransferase
MDSPWLEIPYLDYESHMSAPGVGQLQVLNHLFRTVMEECNPQSLAVLGCCTGNGFEHIPSGTPRRVLAVDINSSYLAELKRRYAASLPGLEIVKCDVESDGLPSLLRGDGASSSSPGVHLIFAALIFEYVDTRKALRNIAHSLVHAGKLVAALQMPSPDSPPVTLTPYKSLEALASVMKLIDPDEFDLACNENGLVRAGERLIPLEHGKKIWVGWYENTNN